MKYIAKKYFLSIFIKLSKALSVTAKQFSVMCEMVSSSMRFLFDWENERAPVQLLAHSTGVHKAKFSSAELQVFPFPNWESSGTKRSTQFLLDRSMSAHEYSSFYVCFEISDFQDIKKVWVSFCKQTCKVIKSGIKETCGITGNYPCAIGIWQYHFPTSRNMK